MTSRAKLRVGVVRLLVLTLLAATSAVAAGTGPAVTAENHPFITEWGTPGTGDGQFDGPRGVAVDGDGFVYVVDTGNDRVQKFTSDGSFVTKWGTTGTGDGQFDNPWGVAVDGDGFVYVTDASRNRVQKFTSDGTFVAKWGTRGTGDGQFDSPSGVAVDSDGFVYVIDEGNVNRRVQKFTSNGTFIRKWGTYGTGNGQFSYPTGVAVDGSGFVYVSDENRVQEFTPNGIFVTKWVRPRTVDGRPSYTGVAVDGNGFVYAVDYGNRVQKFGSPPRPDGRIKKGASGTYVGNDVYNNVYNTTGVGQTRRGSAARGGTVTYFVSAQTDAPFPDQLRLKGTASNSSFTVTYSTGQTDITNEVTAGTYTTPTLPPGAALVVEVEVTVTSTAPAGTSLSAFLKVKSNTDPTIKDTVRFVTSST